MYLLFEIISCIRKGVIECVLFGYLHSIPTLIDKCDTAVLPDGTRHLGVRMPLFRILLVSTDQLLIQGILEFVFVVWEDFLMHVDHYVIIIIFKI